LSAFSHKRNHASSPSVTLLIAVGWLAMLGARFGEGGAPVEAAAGSFSESFGEFDAIISDLGAPAAGEVPSSIREIWKAIEEGAPPMEMEEERSADAPVSPAPEEKKEAPQAPQEPSPHKEPAPPEELPAAYPDSL
jgi:hypothetical protein